MVFCLPAGPCRLVGEIIACRVGECKKDRPVGLPYNATCCADLPPASPTPAPEAIEEVLGERVFVVDTVPVWRRDEPADKPDDWNEHQDRYECQPYDIEKNVHERSSPYHHNQGSL